jgi:hypothetical protein
MRKKFLLIITCLYFLSPFQTSEYTFPVYFSSSHFFLGFESKRTGKEERLTPLFGRWKKMETVKRGENFPFGPIKPTLPPFRERMSGKFCSKN